MTCKACGDELVGRRTYGPFHRVCVDRVLAEMRRSASGRPNGAGFPHEPADK